MQIRRFQQIHYLCRKLSNHQKINENPQADTEEQIVGAALRETI